MDEDFKAGWMMTSVDTNAGYTYEIDVTNGTTTAIAAISASGINTMDVSEDGRALVHPPRTGPAASATSTRSTSARAPSPASAPPA